MIKDNSPLFPALPEKTVSYKKNRAGRKIATMDRRGHSAGGQALQHMRILLVEDNLINQEVAVDMLDEPGLQVDVCMNGREAVDACQQQHYDLVFMDCEMPVMNGYIATRKIREYESQQQRAVPVPIIALTANAVGGVREKCLASGMNDFLSKPFSFECIRTMLKKWAADKTAIEMKKKVVKIALSYQPTPAASLVEGKNSVIDRQVIQRLRKSQRVKVGDSGRASLVSRLIVLFLQQTPVMLTRFSQAADEENIERIADIAHSLKSSCRAIGALSMAEICYQIESAGREGSLEISAIKQSIIEINYKYQQVEKELNNILRSEN